MTDASKPFAGRAAIVTGATRGIGRAIALELARRGANIAFNYAKSVEAAETLKAEIEAMDVRALGTQCDVASTNDAAEMVKQTKDAFGRIDFLINNAGAAHVLANVERLSPEEFRRVVDINLVGTFLCCRSAIPLMSSGAVIVNNLSVAAHQPFAGMSAYNASKAGALALTNTLREELRGQGIRVLALVPGAVDTDIWQQFWPEAPREKMVSTQDVARAVLLALSMPPNTSIDEIRMGPASGTL